MEGSSIVTCLFAIFARAKAGVAERVEEGKRVELLLQYESHHYRSHAIIGREKSVKSLSRSRYVDSLSYLGVLA